MTGRKNAFTGISLLLICMSWLLPIVTQASETCGTRVQFQDPGQEWTGRKDAMCADHVRIRGVTLFHNYISGDDWDSDALSITCCTSDFDPYPNTDHCVDHWLSTPGE